LAILYLIGAFLHILDLFNLRLKFSEMSWGWKLWIVYLCFFDFAAAIGLWNQRRWGILLFLIVAASQLIAYIGFSSFLEHSICSSFFIFSRWQLLGPSSLGQEKCRSQSFNRRQQL